IIGKQNYIPSSHSSFSERNCIGNQFQVGGAYIAAQQRIGGILNWIVIAGGIGFYKDCRISEQRQLGISVSKIYRMRAVEFCVENSAAYSLGSTNIPCFLKSYICSFNIVFEEIQFHEIIALEPSCDIFKTN